MTREGTFKRFDTDISTCEGSSDALVWLRYFRTTVQNIIFVSPILISQTHVILIKMGAKLLNDLVHTGAFHQYISREWHRCNTYPSSPIILSSITWPKASAIGACWDHICCAYTINPTNEGLITLQKLDLNSESPIISVTNWSLPEKTVLIKKRIPRSISTHFLNFRPDRAIEYHLDMPENVSTVFYITHYTQRERESRFSLLYSHQTIIFLARSTARTAARFNIWLRSARSSENHTRYGKYTLPAKI